MWPEWPALVFWLRPNMVRWLSGDTSARLSWFYDPQIWPIPNHNHFLKQQKLWHAMMDGLKQKKVRLQWVVRLTNCWAQKSWRCSWQDCTLLFSAFLSTSSYTTSHHYSLVCLLVHALIQFHALIHMFDHIYASKYIVLTTSNTNPQFKSTFSSPGPCSLEWVILGWFFQITLLQAGIYARHTKE